MKANFLFELGCEELPASIVTDFPNNLKLALSEKLINHGFEFTDISCYATPRRLAFIIHNINAKLESKTELKKGPPVSAAWDPDNKPTQALLGFARSLGLKEIDRKTFTTLTTEKGEWLTYNLQIPGATLQESLPKIIQELFRELFSNKLMTWGNGEFAFVRPVHWIVMLYGNKLVNAKLFNLQTNNITYGHTFHAPGPIVLKDSSEYLPKLLQAYVVVDQDLRRKKIFNQVQKIAKIHAAIPTIPEELLNEITAIVEWPKAYVGNIDNHFLQLPLEVITTTLQLNQRCITLVKDGKLLPFFVTIANIHSKTSRRVIKGNEQVVRSRLSDALFFFENDQKRSLESYRVKTQDVILRDKMGTLFDKSERLIALTSQFASLFTLNLEHVMRAASLSQCDLLTNMVNEFPNLQGIMGFHYARLQNEHIVVAEALKEYYQPRFAEDTLPKTQLGLLLAMADRMDNLVGSFMLGQQPTGVKDPFKLRRQALAVARLLTIVEHASFDAWFNASWQQWIKFGLQPKISAAEVYSNLHTFILERLLNHYEAQGVQKSIVQAVLASGNDLFYDVEQRILAVQKFLMLPEADSLIAACKRVNNILAKQQLAPAVAINSDLLFDTNERRLYDIAVQLSLVQYHNYVECLLALAKLKIPIDDFFTEVMVLVPEIEIRNNRLALLQKLQQILRKVADLGLI
jgi:glycyl-tRNA synthetase beta chain